ncbi:MAG: hypothetical protein L3J10_05095 [Sulfurimonas sp.]|nr:hypothetical protein [Sulfurimonas sp.]
MQHLIQHKNLSEVTINFTTQMKLKEYFCYIANHISNDYYCTPWESVNLGKGWFYLLNTSKTFDINEIIVSNKTFSYLVNYIVFSNINKMPQNEGLEEKHLNNEAAYILENLMNSIELILNEEERFQFYKLID